MSQHTHLHEMKVYGEVKLFCGTGSPDLAGKIADYLNVPLCDYKIVEFPNENLFVQLRHSVRGQDVYLIQHTASPVHRNLMELLITIQTLRAFLAKPRSVATTTGLTSWARIVAII